MADLTIAELVARAARELGKNPTGQAVKGSVSADLTQAYAEVWRMLDRKGLVTWDNDEKIPEEYCNPMAFLVANQRLSGVSDDRFQRIKLEASRAVNEIKSIKEGIWVNTEEVEDY